MERDVINIGDIVYMQKYTDIIEGEIMEITETPLAHDYNISFTFSFRIRIKDSYRTNTCFYENGDYQTIYSSSFHLNPDEFKNVNWTCGGRFAGFSVFTSYDEIKKYKLK